MLRRSLAAAAAVVTLAAACVASPAAAGGSVYAGRPGVPLYDDASVVVLMREGTRTVVSMQNAYKGPPEAFAMVVPVPAFVPHEGVKTLRPELFERLDALTAPRLLEYWEKDPCAAPPPPERGTVQLPAPDASVVASVKAGVKVEADFTHAEYQIEILSAQESTELESWLRAKGYALPAGAEPYLRPYVQAGFKFFVAKVDPTKVKLDGGLTQLSPLRFHYDSPELRLPLRLGLASANGPQDVIVHVLARGQRYEVKDRPNVHVPTNLDVTDAAVGQLGAFYTALFDRTLAKSPKAAVTEYAWDATSCDPCSGKALDGNDLATLGLDVMPSGEGGQAGQAGQAPKDGGLAQPSGFVHTRLHLRYTKDTLGEDLVFQEAAPLTGGRENREKDGRLERTTLRTTASAFQARYAVRHPWTAPITCKDPRRGVWLPRPPSAGGLPGDAHPKVATKLGFAPRNGAALATWLKEDVPEIGFTKGEAAGAGAPGEASARKGCGGCALVERGEPPGGLVPWRSAGWLALAGGAVVVARRARRRRREAAAYLVR